MGPPLGPEGGRDSLRAGEAGEPNGWVGREPKGQAWDQPLYSADHNEDSDSHIPGSKLRWRSLTVLSALSIKWG